MKKSLLKIYLAIIIIFHQLCNIFIAISVLISLFLPKLIENFTLDLAKQLSIDYLYLIIANIVLNVVALLAEYSTWKLFHNQKSQLLVILSLNYIPIIVALACLLLFCRSLFF